MGLSWFLDALADLRRELRGVAPPSSSLVVLLTPQLGSEEERERKKKEIGEAMRSGREKKKGVNREITGPQSRGCTSLSSCAL